MHDVHRRLLIADQALDGFVNRRSGPRVDQRHRSHGVADRRTRTPGGPVEFLAELADISQRGRHDDELGLREFHQGHLPGPAPIPVGNEVELIHHHLIDCGATALTQRDVGQDLSGAAHDGGIGIDRRVAGDHADIVGAEDATQGEELLADQRLDRCGVVAAPALGESREVCCGGDQRFSGPGRGRDDDIGAGEDLQNGLFLVRIQADAVRTGGVDHSGVQGIRVSVGGHASRESHRAHRLTPGRPENPPELLAKQRWPKRLPYR